MRALAEKMIIPTTMMNNKTLLKPISLRGATGSAGLDCSFLDMDLKNHFIFTLEVNESIYVLIYF